MQDTFLGIDLGTTRLKVAIIDHGQVTYQNTSALTTYSGAHGARYQSATEILQQLTELLLGIPVEERTKIQTIALSTAMHSTWPVDPASEQNDQIFIWSDRQAAGVMADFRQSELSKIFYQKTGTPIHPMTPFAKIKYFKRQMPTRYSSETKWLGLKELLLEFLTGKDVLDYPTANATGLFNIHELRWDADILADLDIGTQNLAELVDWQTPLKLKQSVVSAFGLAKSVAVYPGASDGVLAAAAGLSQSGNGNSLTIGTSAAVRRVSQEIVLDSHKQNFCYYLRPKCYVIGAPTNNGGVVLDWAKQIFSPGEGTEQDFYQELSQSLTESPIGANGVLFLPFLNGERAPYWDATLTAQFTHLRVTTTRADMLRAIVEGVLLNIRSLTELVAVKEKTTASGGFFENTALSQLAADILGVDLDVTPGNEPIAGLYSLLTGKPVIATQRKDVRQIKFDAAVHEQYRR